MSGSMSFDNISSLMRTSESFSDLNAELNPVRGRTTAAAASSAAAAASPGNAGVSSGKSSSTTSSSLTSDENATANKPFGLGKTPLLCTVQLQCNAQMLIGASLPRRVARTYEVVMLLAILRWRRPYSIILIAGGGICLMPQLQQLG